MKRENGNPLAAKAEAVVFSWLRAEKLEPRIFEVVGEGGPDFCCSPAPDAQFLVEATSLDSEKVAERSTLPAVITAEGGGPYALITEKLEAKAQSKTRQLSGSDIPTVLAIVSDHAFADLLLSGGAAEYLMTSAPKINVPRNGGETYMTTDLKNAVFHHATGLFNASGAPIIKPARKSISAILLITCSYGVMGVVGLLHPEAANPFNPQWLPSVPFVKFAGVFSHTNIRTEWIQSSDERHRAATFPYRKIS